MIKYSTVAALLLSPAFAFANAAPLPEAMSSLPPEEASMPFGHGERLVYEISLLGITAGSAELRVEDGQDGEWRLHASGRTVGATDSIFGMRQSASCTVQGDALTPEVCLYTSQQRKGMKRREVRYDSATGDVRERTVEDGKRSEKTRNFGEEGVQEALSGFYLLRKRFPVEGETMSFRAIRKGKPITVEAKALGTETIKTSAGTFVARVVDLRIVTSVDKDAAKQAKVWFTDDERRIPIKVSVDAPVGSLQAVLTSDSRTQGGSLAGR